MARSFLVLLCTAVLATAGEPSPPPAGEVILAAGRARTVLGGGDASVSLIRRGALGLVRTEDVAVGHGARGRQAMARRELIGDHLLVRPTPGSDPAAIARAVGGAVRGRAGRHGPWLITVPVQDHADLPAALAILAKDHRVAHVEPDWVVQPIGEPGDPSFAQLWGMHNTGQTGGTVDADIDAPEAWDVATGSGDVLVGIIDTGIDRAHADLASNMWVNPGEDGLDGSGNDRRSNGIDDDGNGFIDDWRGWDFINGDNDPADDIGHGTHCAGTIGAVGGNGIGVAGVCWRVSMVGIKFLGPFGGTTAGAIASVDYARTIGCSLTSNSWGGGGFSQDLSDAIAAAGAAGQLFVAAAGNSAGDNDLAPTYPASYPLWNIISVAATDHSDLLAYFSCFGATSVDLAAPGVSVLSTLPGDSYGLNSGTSMATPHVAGACALLRSVNASIGAAELKQALLDNADPIPALAGKTLTGARLNAHRALLAVAGAQVVRDSLSVVEDGDGDGLLNPGESARITLGLRSAGTETVLGAAGVLTSTDADLEILDGRTEWGDLPPRTISAGDGAFVVRLPSGAATPRDITAVITITAAVGGPWSFPVSLQFRTSSILAGHVRRVGTLATVAGATVTCAGPGGGSTISDADGAWSIRVSDGTYAISATAPGLAAPGPVTVAAPPGGQGIDVLLGHPALEASPDRYGITLEEGGRTTVALQLSNDGDMTTHAVITAQAQDWTATGLWHRANWRSPPGGTAWYYGRDDTRTYDTGSTNSGTLTLPSVHIPAGSGTLSFRDWRQTENLSPYDVCQLQASLDGGATWVVRHQTTSDTAVWRQVAVPIADLAGRDVLLRFLFDTVDPIANNFEGWYVDDPRIDGMPIASWLTVAPGIRDVDAGGSASIDLTVSAADLAPGTYTASVQISSDAPDQPLISIPVELTVQGAPRLVFDRMDRSDTAGSDGDGWPEPGETVNLDLFLRNGGSATAIGVAATLHSDDPRLTVIEAATSYPDLMPGGLAQGLTPLTVRIAEDCPNATDLAMHANATDGSGRTWTIPLSLVVDVRGRISGTATNTSGVPLANVTVSVAGYSTASNAAGDYAIDGIPAGTHLANVNAPEPSRS